MVEHNRTARETKKQGGYRAPHIHAVPSPLRRRGQTHLIVVLGIAECVIEEEWAGPTGIEVVGRAPALIDVFQRIITVIVIDRVKPRREQLGHDRAFRHGNDLGVPSGHAGRIRTISFSHPIDTRLPQV